MIISRKKFEQAIQDAVDKAVAEERDWHQDIDRDRRFNESISRLSARVRELEIKAGIAKEKTGCPYHEIHSIDND